MSKAFIKVVVVMVFAVIFAFGQSEKKRYAAIKQAGGVVVRADVEPGANMVMMAREGQKFEVLGEPGKLWLKIKTENGDGYIPISSCDIKDGLKSNYAGSIILLIVLLGAIGGGAYYYVFYFKKGIIRKEDSNIL
ncbi:MAG: hypothetical protein LBH98_10270 [Chitinispirillales bacterium]|jgi:hypothetical protein|nr:hypothetical protein [Chitinispirillales bacterium]